MSEHTDRIIQDGKNQKHQFYKDISDVDYVLPNSAKDILHKLIVHGWWMDKDYAVSLQPWMIRMKTLMQKYNFSKNKARYILYCLKESGFLVHIKMEFGEEKVFIQCPSEPMDVKTHKQWLMGEKHD